MNWGNVAKRLGITEQRLSGLQESILKRSSWPEPKLWRFEKAASGIETGSVIFENGEVAFGYPKIRRPLMLNVALKRHFSDLVAVEEKMNGHNLRILTIGGDIIALTRGGFICPYSTEVAGRLIPEELFLDHPDIILCAEMVGPENPYVPKYAYPTDTVDLYLFDVAKKNQKGTFGVHKTHDLAEEYGLRAAAFFGEFKTDLAAEKIRRIVKDLGGHGREGVVIKDPENVRSPMKYTPSETNCSDLAWAFRYYNDFAYDFFISRVIREGFQSVDWNESSQERDKRALLLGKSILFPLIETVERKKSGENIVQEVKIRVKSLSVARDFEYHLHRSGVRAIFEPPVPDDEWYLIRITKFIMSTNDKTQGLLLGEMW